MKILIIGVTGMLGNAMIKILSENACWQVYGTVRSESSKRFFESNISSRLIFDVDVEQIDSLIRIFNQIRPNVVINCVGLVKQAPEADDVLRAIPINTLLPHRLAGLCEMNGARLIHMSTDCVFSGDKGNYRETDSSDAKDIYGKSKYLGELAYSHTVTLRTSIIGHGLESHRGLVDWFLSQEDRCLGYSKAIFSGLPTVILSQIVRDIVIPHPELVGIYHVAAQPISKLDLLKLVAYVYGKSIDIVHDSNLVVNRSLNADRFREATGYVAPEWPTLIKIMHSYK